MHFLFNSAVRRHILVAIPLLLLVRPVLICHRIFCSGGRWVNWRWLWLYQTSSWPPRPHTAAEGGPGHKIQIAAHLYKVSNVSDFYMMVYHWNPVHWKNFFSIFFPIYTHELYEVFVLTRYKRHTQWFAINVSTTAVFI